ncbi:FR47 domain-containing protein [Caballeronia hypogeia]|uniref:FR47 domain-containing protein n=1 Tax=Caballeronia hypogeia TaxID=1777140 RepID=A0A158CWU6_9BURK|nr:GNAT family N-acetyltransferase [Caballeronia hypogeia]SAK86691.1 FR47 domain-containing protein [Caballeronia hypogeia]
MTLDRPVWTALTTRQAHLGEGDALARRYDPDIAPFAAVDSESPNSWRALGAMLKPQERAAVLSPGDVEIEVEGIEAQRLGTIHQMIDTQRFAESTDDRDMIRLAKQDVPDMLELAQRTRPGPFGKRTHEMGNYIGIRDEGRLIAMAGERMRMDGHVEISAVCVDEQWRGRGIAARLINVLRREIAQRGETPFLHVFSHNTGAIGLYERLGFALRHEFMLTQLVRAA